MSMSAASATPPAGAPWFERVRLGLGRRWPRAGASPRQAFALDLALVVGAFALFTLPELTPVSGLGRGYGSPAAVAVFGALAVVPLVARRRWPTATLASVTAVLCAAALAGVRLTPFVSSAGPALVLAAGTVASRRPRRASLVACAAAAVATSAAGLVAFLLHADQDQDAVQLALVAVGWLAGDALRVRREYRDGLELARRRERAEHEHRVRAEERLRLSRDVHDIVSHTLSMIAVRAGVARHLLADGAEGPARPDTAVEALAVIETASRSALDELRRVLRQSRVPGTDDLAAMPTLADVPALVDTVRRHGLAVTFSAAESPEAGTPSFPLVLETSAYRVVQEALTNVTRHAAATRAWVEIEHRHGELVVTVRDDGGGQAAGSGPGLGLTGMRERAELLGGTLAAGSRPDGGFEVVAVFPVVSDER
ncbi:sensor histidine kinase [Frankia sp. AgB1.9]|uniref:sensor histidine kinase n=1 Tax=unclassified Frankia TaxID=2632575 RepID=UPI001934A0FC|nr:MULTISPECIES: sensor histidine kinase [unclassified Frankia]MBL7488779.1 sensor histidine kinase [Frankia sp. AgW1.1]MBL7546540.1 sensor histidine kinase [Frankia sp. AgB1.9]MBL7625090.1 sensor histidine kinase [Frankia sp. AgB1.8]